MRELVERALTPHGVADQAGGRRVTVNLAESPLSWLKARGLVSAR